MRLTSKHTRLENILDSPDAGSGHCTSHRRRRRRRRLGLRGVRYDFLGFLGLSPLLLSFLLHGIICVSHARSIVFCDSARHRWPQKANRRTISSPFL